MKNLSHLYPGVSESMSKEDLTKVLVDIEYALNILFVKRNSLLSKISSFGEDDLGREEYELLQSYEEQIAYLKSEKGKCEKLLGV